jgi:hypothetical protein
MVDPLRLLKPTMDAVKEGLEPGLATAPPGTQKIKLCQ